MAKKKTTKKKVVKKTSTAGQGELGFGAKPAADNKATAKKAPAKKVVTKKVMAKKTSAKDGPPRLNPETTQKRNTTDTPVARRIMSESSSIRNKILLGEKPNMKFPLRSLSNVTYNAKTGYFKLKGKQKERTLTDRKSVV